MMNRNTYQRGKQALSRDPIHYLLHIIYGYILIYSGNIRAISIPYLSLLADHSTIEYHPLLDRVIII